MLVLLVLPLLSWACGNSRCANVHPIMKEDAKPVIRFFEDVFGHDWRMEQLVFDVQHSRLIKIISLRKLIMR